MRVLLNHLMPLQKSTRFPFILRLYMCYCTLHLFLWPFWTVKHFFPFCLIFGPFLIGTQVAYDDGDVEVLMLRKEKWECIVEVYPWSLMQLYTSFFVPFFWFICYPAGARWSWCSIKYVSKMFYFAPSICSVFETMIVIMQNVKTMYAIYWCDSCTTVVSLASC